MPSLSTFKCSLLTFNMSILSLFHIASPFLRSNCMEEKSIYEDFICSVCLDLCNTPVITVCNHISCYKCLYYSLLHKKKCPICKQPIGQNNVKQLTGAKRREYERIRMKCELCDKVIRIKNYQRHKDQCEYKRCKNFILGCEYFDKKNKISVHEEHCEHILTSCSSCSNLFHFKNRVFILDLKERYELKMHNTYTFCFFYYNLLLNTKFNFYNYNGIGNSANSTPIGNGSDTPLCVNTHFINSFRKFREIHNNIARNSWNSEEEMNVHILENIENLQNRNATLRNETHIEENSNNINTNIQIKDSQQNEENISCTASDIQNYNQQSDDIKWKTLSTCNSHDQHKSKQLHEKEKQNTTGEDNINFVKNESEDEKETYVFESEEEEDGAIDEFINILPLRKKFSFKESNGKDIITIIEELFQFDEVDISNIYVEHTDMFLCNKNCFNDTIRKLRFELEKASSLLNFCCCIGMPVMFTLGGISYLITRGIFKFSIFLTSAFVNISHKLFIKIFKT